jgi:CTP:molybdopterin cytidylyltransferase MocA
VSRVFLTPCAYNDLLSLPEAEIKRVQRILNGLPGRLVQGTRLWGQEGLLLLETGTGNRVIYRQAGVNIEVLGIKPQEFMAPAPAHLRIAAVVLAAGHTDYANTLPLSAAADSFREAGVDDLIMVVGDHAQQARAELSRCDVTLVVNEDYDDGLAKSLRYGLRMLAAGTRAVLLSLGNRPFITPQTVTSLIRAFKTEGTPVVVPAHSQMRGHPVLFDARLVPELLRAEGNCGGRAVLAHHRQELTQIDINDAGVLEKVWTN